MNVASCNHCGTVFCLILFCLFTVAFFNLPRCIYLCMYMHMLVDNHFGIFLALVRLLLSK